MDIPSGSSVTIQDGLSNIGDLTVVEGNGANLMISDGIFGDGDITFTKAAGSVLGIDGGVLQSNSEVTFSRNLGTSGSTFQWTENGGGFAAGALPSMPLVQLGDENLSYGTFTLVGPTVSAVSVSDPDGNIIVGGIASASAQTVMPKCR